MAGGMQPTRVVALTPAGAVVARRLSQALAAECWLPISKAAAGDQPFAKLASVFADAFAARENLVCVMAAGIVVRGIAPYLRGKNSDPAVVVVDEEGRFAVSLLSGHLGGANELACRVAAALKGTPVITTATDIQGLPALDVIAQQAGLVIENLASVKEVAMTLLSGQPVGLVDPAGLLAEVLSPFEHLFHPEGDVDAALAAGIKPTVYVGYQERNWPAGWLRLRPGCLIAGVGCHRGIAPQEILTFIQEIFRQERLSLVSLQALASIAVKKEEPGLREAARRLNVEILWFTAEELERVPVPHPSAQAARYVGAKSVSEAAALKASQGGELVVAKRKSANVTVAVARAILPS